MQNNNVKVADLYPSQMGNSEINNAPLNSSAVLMQASFNVTLPAFSRWFEMDSIHQIQRDAFPEFFLEDENETKSFCKGPSLYRFYRNFMVTVWRQNTKKYLAPALCRKNLPGDVSSIIRIHAFLENWGIINFPQKQHVKGIIERQSQKMACYICEQTKAEAYYVAEIQTNVLFQICDCCFHGNYFPSCIEKEEFRKIIPEVHEKKKKKQPTLEEMKKILDIMHSESSKEKEMWIALGKEFPNYTREEILLNFLEIPSNQQMIGNIFTNGEDIIFDSDPQDSPTIFQNYQNPIQTNIAMSYYLFKTHAESYPELKQLFKASEKHSKFLGAQQAQKIRQLTKMLIDVQLSKLELKSLYIQQFEKLLSSQQSLYKKNVANKLAEGLRNLPIEEVD